MNRQSSSDVPFYAQVGFFETHQPFDFGGVQPDTANGIHMPGHLLRCPENEQKMALLQGALKTVDGAIGTILQTLHDTGLDENTLVLFTVDHGIEMPRAKFTLYDPGVHVPLVMHWPAGGLSGGRIYPHLTGNVDVLPTVMDLLGLPMEPQFEGISFADQLLASTSKPHRDCIFAGQFGGDARAVRSERYKLIRNFVARKPFSPPVNPESPYVPGAPCPLVEMYDLENDPHEFNNVAELPEYAQARQSLDTTLWKWMKEIDDPIFKGPVPHWMWAENMAQSPL